MLFTHFYKSDFCIFMELRRSEKQSFTGDYLFSFFFFLNEVPRLGKRKEDVA